MGETRLSFKRYEKKYLLSAGQYARLMEKLREHIEPDEYFQSTVCSLYYDTADCSLIRHSVEAPVYKEKLRLRSYGVPTPESPVFVELKKKYKGIVYKRRVTMAAAEAARWLRGESGPPEDGQMEREIDWFLRQNRPVPRAYIACERTAWRAVDDPELRITFDERIRWRETDLDLCAGSEGEPLTEEGQVLMELKIPQAAPLWLARLLSDEQLFPTGFSKYGTAYKDHILQELFEVTQHA